VHSKAAHIDEIDLNIVGSMNDILEDGKMIGLLYLKLSERKVGNYVVYECLNLTGRKTTL